MVTRKHLKEQIAIASFVISVYEKRHNADHEKYMALLQKYDKACKDRDFWESAAKKLDFMRLEKLNDRRNQGST